MGILCFGSINIDWVYRVERFVRPGETISSKAVSRNLGGKGANQAIAMAQAGCNVNLAGKIGRDGADLLAKIERNGVDISLVHTDSSFTGNAMIQVDDAGQNSIILFGGGNREIGTEQIEDVLSGYGVGDWLVLQNEINAIPEIMRLAKDRGMRIVFNPSPFDGTIFDYPLDLVDLFVVNEHEGAALASVPESAGANAVLEVAGSLFDKTSILLTLGGAGAWYTGPEGRFFQEAIDAPVVDTTAAGDTFLGYFIASFSRGLSVPESMRMAAIASSITISRFGAADSIPTMDEVLILEKIR